MIKVNINENNTIILPDKVMKDLNAKLGDELIFIRTKGSYIITNDVEMTIDHQLINIKKIFHEVDNIMDTITSISLEDDVYSDKEIYLTNFISEQIEEYKLFLSELLKKESLEHEEYERVISFGISTLEKAKNIVINDEITADEKKILDNLESLFVDLYA